MLEVCHCSAWSRWDPQGLAHLPHIRVFSKASSSHKSSEEKTKQKVKDGLLGFPGLPLKGEMGACQGSAGGCCPPLRLGASI